MSLDFPYPIADGTVITGAMLNNLIASIQDGTIFTSPSYVGDLVGPLMTRVAALEDSVTILQGEALNNCMRDQFTLRANQPRVTLSKVPVLDSESVYINGSLLNRDGIPPDSVNDYSVAGGIISFEPAFSLSIKSGDKCVVTYQYPLGS